MIRSIRKAIQILNHLPHRQNIDDPPQHNAESRKPSLKEYISFCSYKFLEETKLLSDGRSQVLVGLGLGLAQKMCGAF